MTKEDEKAYIAHWTEQNKTRHSDTLGFCDIDFLAGRASRDSEVDRLRDLLITYRKAGEQLVKAIKGDTDA